MKSFWLQNEFYYLKVEDKNILTTEDAWLNDRIMDAAQKLICKALGKIDSYQLVLNSEKKTNYPFRTVNNEHYDGNSRLESVIGNREIGFTENDSATEFLA